MYHRAIETRAACARRPRVCVGWKGLPFYALRSVKACVNLPCWDLSVVVLQPEWSPEAQQELQLPVHTLHVDQPTCWHDVGLPVPDLFIHTGWCHPSFNSLARQVRKRGGAVVGMVDNSWNGTLRQVAGAIVFRLGLRARYKIMLVPGESGVRLMRYFGYPRARVLTGLYGADPTVFTPGPALDKRPKQFLYVGQLIKRKDPELAIRVFQNLGLAGQGWRFLLVGAGPLAEPLSKSAPRGVEFAPKASSPAVAEYMASSRFLVLPSMEENWGVVVHEAALCGCGLILSDRVGARHDLVGERNGFVFRAGDGVSLSAAISRASSLSATELEGVFQDSVTRAREFGPSRWKDNLVTVRSMVLE
jgi:glycosyltransferase involved in cell wall biosynthesis